MAIDTSMYGRVALPDLLGSYQQGKKWRQEQDAIQKQQQTEQAMKGIYQLGPDGKMSINQEALTQYAQLDPRGAYQIHRNQEEDALKQQQILDEKAYKRDYLNLMRQKAQEKFNATKNMSPFDKVLSGLGAEERKRFDNIRMGKTALDNMGAALAGGDNTFSIFGDNNFTMAESQWEEAIGRMQSGGAINAEEAQRFRRLVPKATDSRQIQVQKLSQMRDEMGRRLSTFGLKPEDVPGYLDKSADEALQSYAAGPASQPSFRDQMDGVGTANADQGPQIKRYSGKDLGL